MPNELSGFSRAFDLSGAGWSGPKTKAAALGLALALLAGPTFAEDAKPPIWIMAVQIKSSLVTITYPTKEKCTEAAKLIGPSLKKLGRADCMPILQQ